MKHYLRTGQQDCYDSDGRVIPCRDSGQDAEFRTGLPWPTPRFTVENELVRDNLTGLLWFKNANPADFPVTWQEAFAYIDTMNRDKTAGRKDWRLPNRRELRSLLAFETRKPALAAGHPFENVFLGWYWTSTTAAIHPGYAWYVHMEGARMFFGRKDSYYLFWPVCGGDEAILPATGQKTCYDSTGVEITCAGTGQDGELQRGAVWPEPRFAVHRETVLDNLTGLYWFKDADCAAQTMSWVDALRYVQKLEIELPGKDLRWRLPTINELESLVDCSRHTPALPEDHPFVNVWDTYWSATTSFFEPDWAWALYFNKGATGVGYKRDGGFHLWPVASQVGL